MTGRSLVRGTGLCPVALPRASALTELLVRSDDAAEGVRQTDLDTVRRRLAAQLGATAPGRRRPVPHDRPPLRVTGYVVRAALTATGRAGPSSTFHWSAVTARRAIGLAAVRACLDGTARTPADGVAGAVSSLADDGRHGLGRSGSLADWLGRLPAPARAVVAAEAVTWATRLWTAVEWDRVGPEVRVGGPDEQWSPPGSPVAVLRGRVDVRIGSAAAPAAFLTLLPGAPGPASRAELGLAPLVRALAAGRRPAGEGPSMPRRVAGWWPDCGRALVVPVGRALLEEAADAVVRAAGSTTWCGGDDGTAVGGGADGAARPDR